MKATILVGDALLRLREIPDGSIQTCVVSPPYWNLRDYGVPGQLGMEKSPRQYIKNLCAILAEVRRVLRADGTLWLNLGDSYAAGGKGGGGSFMKERRAWSNRANQKGWKSAPDGMKAKDLVGIPWMAAFALRKAGWFLRSEIIWAKPNGMPGSQEDRCTSSHETIFLLAKRHHYFSDFDSIKTPPRESSMIRAAQDIQSQAGSHRVHAGAREGRPMKSVGVKAHISEKQRGHSRRHNGFNDRWDQMTVEEQQSMPAMMRDVWFVPPAQFRDSHFAVMPEEVARRCILAGSREGDKVLDFCCGSGTTGVVALAYGREFIGIELKREYAEMARDRIIQSAPLFNTVVVEVSTSTPISSVPSETANPPESIPEAAAP